MVIEEKDARGGGMMVQYMMPVLYISSYTVKKVSGFPELALAENY